MMNPTKLLVTATAITLMAGSGAAAQPMKCKKIGGFAGPVVRDDKSARAIFLIVEKSLDPKANVRDFPEVVVRDAGDHWDVARVGPRDRPAPGGGQLQLEINKCTGAISNAYAQQ